MLFAAAADIASKKKLGDQKDKIRDQKKAGAGVKANQTVAPSQVDIASKIKLADHEDKNREGPDHDQQHSENMIGNQPEAAAEVGGMIRDQTKVGAEAAGGGGVWSGDGGGMNGEEVKVGFSQIAAQDNVSEEGSGEGKGDNVGEDGSGEGKGAENIGVGMSGDDGQDHPIDDAEAEMIGENGSGEGNGEFVFEGLSSNDREALNPKQGNDFILNLDSLLNTPVWFRRKAVDEVSLDSCVLPDDSVFPIITSVLVIIGLSFSSRMIATVLQLSFTCVSDIYMSAGNSRAQIATVCSWFGPR